MTTPSMAFSVCLRNAIATIWLAWLVSFVVTRIYALHEAYVAEVGKRNDERWLLKQCSDPEFYANLRQHSDLCTEVANNARASLFLRALNKVMENSMHLCGSMSCTDAVYSLAFRMGWTSVAILGILLLAAPNIIFMLARSLWNRRIAGLERALFEEGSRGCMFYGGEDPYRTGTHLFATSGYNKSPGLMEGGGGGGAHSSSIARDSYVHPAVRFRRSLSGNKPIAFPAADECCMLQVSSSRIHQKQHESNEQPFIGLGHSSSTIKLV